MNNDEIILFFLWNKHIQNRVKQESKKGKPKNSIGVDKKDQEYIQPVIFIKILIIECTNNDHAKE